MARTIPTFKPIDPKLNAVGSIVPWTPGVYVCPFCGLGTISNGCGFNGNYAKDTQGFTINTQVKMTGICTKVAANPANPTNPNGPHNNIIGAEYASATNCPFCGGHASKCGFGGTGNGPGTRGIVEDICGNTPSGVVLGAAGKLLAAAVVAKPLINCHLCGAWGADKHRRGCKAGGI